MNDSTLTNIPYSYKTKKRWVVTSRDIAPVLCACAAFKYSWNYYSFIIPFMSGFFGLLYNAITLLFLLMYIPLSLKAISLSRRYSFLKLTIIIPFLVFANILYVIIQTGDFSCVLRNYEMPLAYGTNDETGFYFSQINTWFGNMAIVIYLALNIKDKRDIIRCISATMAVLVIPILLIILLHPSYLGTRQSRYENNTNFAGGLWNIGVVGFGSVSWIGIGLIKYASRNQKRFIYFSMILFVFVGVAGLSRTIILMLALSMITYFLLTRKNMYWVAKVVLILFGVAVFALFETNIFSLMLYRFSDGTAGVQNIRIQLWRAYLSHFKEYWLIGAPVGSVYNYYRDVNLIGAHFLPHCSIINFMVRFGVFAAISYVLMIKRAFWDTKKSAENEQMRNCILSGGVAYISLAFINQTGYAEIVFYVMFGLLLALNKLEELEECEK